MLKRKTVNAVQGQLSSGSVDHQRLVALVNSMSDAVVAFDADGRAELTNSAALNLFDSNNLAGKHIDEFMKLSDEKGKSLKAANLLRPDSTYSSTDISLVYADGSRLNLDINVSPVRLGFGTGKAGYVMLARDITASKSIEQERDEFVSVASHELRTPIAITEGNISNALILAKAAGVSDAVYQSLSDAHDQSLFLGALVNDLSMLSRASREAGADSIKKISVLNLLEKLTNSYKGRAGEKKLNFKLSISDPKLAVKSNELYVKEILQNFITNAIKYTGKGSIEILGESQPGFVKLTVKDSGFGISISEQKKLFKKFFRSEDPRIQVYTGSGLGLYVCAKLAKLIGGRLEVKSELDHGSSFSLYLPAEA